MDLHDEENAERFDTRPKCQEWIDQRIVRFKLRMIPYRTMPDDPVQYAPRKEDGQIVDTTAEGFKGGGIDEPLSNYAEPLRKGDKWFAIMKLQ